MAQCFNCGTSRGQKRLYRFSVDRKNLSYLEKMDINLDGSLTKMLCSGCAKMPELAAQPARKPE